MKGVLFSIILILIGSVSAASWYVDNAATGSNSGTSWVNAWQSFASINWGSVNPGDTIYISGGSSSKTYNEGMIVASSGTSGNLITIMPGADSGHNGKVLLDGLDSIDNGFENDYNDYINLRGLEFDNFVSTGGISLKGCEYCIIENNLITHTTGHAGIKLDGFSQSNTNTIISNNSIIIPKGTYTSQTDGIYSQVNTDLTIEGNYIYIGNDHPTPHCDCFQAFKDVGGRLNNNYCEQDNDKTSNAQGLYLEDVTGSYLIYNNVVKLRQGGIKFNEIYNNQGSADFYNNIILILGGYKAFATGDLNSIVKNNIFYSTGTGPVIEIYDTPSSTSNYNNNIMYAPSSNYPVSCTGCGGANTWAEWTGAGYDANSITSDPNLDFNDGLRPLLGSQAIDAGQDFSGIFSIDKDRTPRPQGSAWDIGAFEYQGTTQQPYNGPHNIPGRVEAEDYDTGGEGVGYHDTTTGNTGGQYRSENVDIKLSNDSSDGGYAIGWVEAGEWIEYTIDVSSAADYTFYFRVLSQMTTGQFHVEIDGFDVTGLVSIPYTGTWDSDSWITMSVSDVSLSAGQHVMRVFVDQNYFDINYIEALVSSACSSADTSGNSIIEIGELLTYISSWKSGSVLIGDLLTAIGEWKNGC